MPKLRAQWRDSRSDRFGDLLCKAGRAAVCALAKAAAADYLAGAETSAPLPKFVMHRGILDTNFGSKGALASL
jgi:hypothetical protein